MKQPQTNKIKKEIKSSGLIKCAICGKYYDKKDICDFSAAIGKQTDSSDVIFIKIEACYICAGGKNMNQFIKNLTDTAVSYTQKMDNSSKNPNFQIKESPSTEDSDEDFAYDIEDDEGE